MGRQGGGIKLLWLSAYSPVSWLQGACIAYCKTSCCERLQGEKSEMRQPTEITSELHMLEHRWESKANICVSASISHSNLQAKATQTSPEGTLPTGTQSLNTGHPEPTIGLWWGERALPSLPLEDPQSYTQSWLSPQHHAGLCNSRHMPGNDRCD